MSPTPIQTRFLSLPRMWQRRLTPSKQKASSRPLPSMRVTWAYSADEETTMRAKRRQRTRRASRFLRWLAQGPQRTSGHQGAALFKALGHTLPVLLEGELALHVAISFSTPTVLATLRAQMGGTMGTTNGCHQSSPLQRLTSATMR